MSFHVPQDKPAAPIALTAGRSSGATSLTVSGWPAGWTSFPMILCALRGAGTSSEVLLTILEVTAQSSGTVTTTGPYSGDGMADSALLTGDTLECRPTKGMVLELQTAIGTIQTTLGTLGTAATHAATDFDAIGAAAAAVTALNATNLLSGTVPAARLPGPTLSTLGGVKAANALTHQFLTGIDTAGAVSQSQPSFTDVSGTAARTQIGTGTPAAGEYVDGATGAWTALPITAHRSVNAQTGTSYTFVLGDADELVTFNNASAVAATLPLHASVALPVLTEIDVFNVGAGATTITPTSGATINGSGSGIVINQWQGGTLKQLTTDAWIYLGSHA